MTASIRFPSAYAEFAPKSPRTLARHAVLSFLAGLWESTGRLRERLARPRVHFVYLHHCFPDEEPAFRSWLKRLSAQHDFVTYSEAVERVRTGVGAGSRPCVAFSFDDGVHNTLAASRILEEFGIRACHFLCPGIVGESDSGRLESFCRDRLHFVPAVFLSWKDVESLLGRGHEIGGHTMTHARVSSLAPGQLCDEIGACRDALQQRAGSVRHFAWPFGRFTDVSAEGRRAVFAAGFKTCASAERGCHVAPHAGALRDLCIRRETIIAAWPVRHSLFLMARSAGRASVRDNTWPDRLGPA